MELSTITEDREVAREAFEEYRAEIRKPLRARATEAQRELRQIDTQMARAYKQLAAGTTLLRLAETIRAGGVEEREVVQQNWGGQRGWVNETVTVEVPRIAIAKADEARVWTSGVTKEGNVRFRWVSENSTAKARSLFVEDAFAESKRVTRWGVQFTAVVPTVPPQYRPNRLLSGYHLLFEASWETAPVPADPALLKHVGGDLWAVLAVWDLSPLEAAVLGHRN